MSTSLALAAATITIASGMPSFAGAQSKGTLAIAENEGLLIDGTSFSITSGKTAGEGANLIKKLDARDLGPGAIIFRVGNRLYISEAPPVAANGSDRYGSDRDSALARLDHTSAQAERDYREWQDSLSQGNGRYGSDRYGSDRVASASPAAERDFRAWQAERDFREWQANQRRFASDQYGSDRYGSNLDSSATAQAERDWREWQANMRRFGSDRYGSDHYGNDRDSALARLDHTSAQDERDYREWQESLRRFGSDRDSALARLDHTSAQDERDYREWQESLRGRSYGSDRYAVMINDPAYALYRLRKAFEDNWTTAENTETP